MREHLLLGRPEQSARSFPNHAPGSRRFPRAPTRTSARDRERGEIAVRCVTPPVRWLHVLAHDSRGGTCCNAKYSILPVSGKAAPGGGLSAVPQLCYRYPSSKEQMYAVYRREVSPRDVKFDTRGHQSGREGSAAKPASAGRQGHGEATDHKLRGWRARLLQAEGTHPWC